MQVQIRRRPGGNEKVPNYLFIERLEQKPADDPGCITHLVTLYGRPMEIFLGDPESYTLLPEYFSQHNLRLNGIIDRLSLLLIGNHRTARAAVRASCMALYACVNGVDSTDISVVHGSVDEYCRHLDLQLSRPSVAESAAPRRLLVASPPSFIPRDQPEGPQTQPQRQRN